MPRSHRAISLGTILFLQGNEEQQERKRMNRNPLLRVRDGGEARVTNEELFFDLIYAFAVTQLSHRLFEDLTLLNALQTLVLWFGVWLGWQYTCWVTNWCDPQFLPVRFMLFVIMLLGLAMAAAIPEAYAERGLVFAGCYVTIQVGRTLFVLAFLGRQHALTANFRRILGWLCISGLWWLLGGFAEGSLRLACWAVAVACEYLAPMSGFWLPGLGRSRTRDWTIEGAHLAERCQLFVLMALGESVLAAGASISSAVQWNAPTGIALLVAFVTSAALWWIYFDTSSKDGSEAIVRSPDPGRIGAYFHYIHVTLIAGIIVAAVGNELFIAHPDLPVDTAALSVLIGGPLLYLAGDAAYARIVYGRLPRSHLAGMLALAVLALTLTAMDTRRGDRLLVGGLVALVLTMVALWQGCLRRTRKLSPAD